MAPSPSEATPVRRRRARRRTAAIAVVGIVSLGGCGSEDGDAASGTDAFCEAVADYADAVRTGDRTSMAGALEGSTEGLPEDAARTVDAYLDSLTAAPPNRSAAADDAQERTVEASFRAYAAETCGADAIPAVDRSSTTTSGTGSGGATTTPDRSTDPGPATTEPGNSGNVPDEGDDQGDDTGPADESESYPYDTTEPEAG